MAHRTETAERIGLVVADEVATALAEGTPVVAMESTIFSNLGLPAPGNREAFDRCEAAVRGAGAVPAVTAVLDGRPRVGLSAADVDRVLTGSSKVAERDVPVAIAQRWAEGMTTVSASVALAHAAGVEVFATGGIGGVHRGVELSGDVSADLDALASHPVVTVCAGAKAFLDLPRTLEHLEAIGVPVLGWQHDWFPAFYSRSVGLAVPHRVEDAATVAGVLRNRLRPDNGVLLAVPIPESAEIPAEEIEAKMLRALAAADEAGVRGPKVTPFVLARIEAETDGESIPANLALAENNAAIAAQVAKALLEA
ncbi:pseudouridine-5'-phosphate glycosidase [Klenkia marina]|uniref:Pseudouridine-5'-phosphate glycosidase n=1 Tax=Klenkia marina TaxID=1960309 RepID=A0A1G4YXQ7_9ACTN|nr:pseudouridine-5'-phosphate glycosidase [Klenkia marina]SCX58141.1 pseudouridine-5'-phosphate glycosidase [Klenkia marina]